MWLFGFSIDNISLMALTIAVGFVVDDAIVMIENVESHVEQRHEPARRRLLGARQIGFTVVSISLSLVAVFIPLLFLPGIAGKLLQEFGYTLTFAIAVSMVVSLTVTPMLCAWLPAPKHKQPTKFDIIFESALDKIVDAYHASLEKVVDHPWSSLVAILLTAAWTVHLYQTIPRGASASRRHRPPQRHDGGRGGRVLRRDGAAAEARHEGARRGSGREGGRLLHRLGKSFLFLKPGTVLRRAEAR